MILLNPRENKFKTEEKRNPAKIRVNNSKKNPLIRKEKLLFIVV